MIRNPLKYLLIPVLAKLRNNEFCPIMYRIRQNKLVDDGDQVRKLRMDAGLLLSMDSMMLSPVNFIQTSSYSSKTYRGIYNNEIFAETHEKIMYFPLRFADVENFVILGGLTV